jgi:hypothetical protein
VEASAAPVAEPDGEAEGSQDEPRTNENETEQ